MAAPWFKIYSTQLLSDEKITLLEDDHLGKLLRLWAHASTNGCTIPANHDALARLLRLANAKQLVKHLDWINKFFAPVEGDPSRLVSLRLLEESKAYEDKCAKLKANGSQGGRPKKPNGYPDGLATGNQMAPEEGRGKKEVEKEKESPTVPRKRATARKAPKDPESLEEILHGGKGTPLWEAYWALVAVFGPAKNPSPKTTARLYCEATGRVGLSYEHVQAKAEALAASTSEQKYLPQLAKWLEGYGYLNPDAEPQRAKSQGRTADIDDDFIAQMDMLGLEKGA